MSGETTSGSVALVGAGPGDPGLITVRGAQLLQHADVVVYDYLASPKLLAHAPQAEHIFVGKQAAKHSMTQDQINGLLIEQAKRGRRVVRLKGGDPFVFGRGGEEGEALKNAGIAFSVVPGITAAIAAPAYAGIPVTHRDFNSSFTLITGHEKEEQYKEDDAKARGAATGSSDLDWSAIAKLPCVAFYMGVKALPRITSKLIAHGMNADTPAATIQWGTTARQRTCVATVGTIAEAVVREKIAAPAITIVGKVVSMRDTLNWFETRPLYGQTIVVTRTRDQASELSARLEALGANVLEAPTIETKPVDDWTEVDAALRSISKPAPHPVASGAGQSVTVIFTSANGVRAVRDRLRELKVDARVFAGTQIAVIGDATARAVREMLCIEPDVVPQKFIAEALADELIARGQVQGNRFLLFRAEIGRPVLIDKLRAAGAARVEDITVYETRPVAALPQDVTDAIANKTVNWITFTSSSTAKNLVLLLGDNYIQQLEGVKIASIGAITSQMLRELGLPPTVEAADASMQALADTISNHTASSDICTR